MPIKLAVFQTHPIQYFAPLWRRLARHRGLDMTVYYLSDSSIRGALDQEFGRSITWDVPLLGGYKHVFLRQGGDPGKDQDMRLENPRGFLKEGGFHCALLPGYSRPFERQILGAARGLDLRVVMRGEFAPAQTQQPLKRLLRGLFLRRTFARVDAFGVIGACARAELLKHGVPQRKLFFSPYAVDDKLFKLRKPSAKLRKSLGLGPQDCVLLFSGKFIGRKSAGTLIKALGRLKDLGPGIKAILLGAGEQASELKDLAARLAPGQVIFPGFVNQKALPEYFSIADVFVLPSLYETWGLVVNEAMQSGLPVLVSDQVHCADDLVLPGETGEVFPAGNAEALAASLRRLVLDPAKRKRYGKAGQRLIANYSVEHAAQGLAEAVESACA